MRWRGAEPELNLGIDRYRYTWVTNLWFFSSRLHVSPFSLIPIVNEVDWMNYRIISKI